MAATVAGAADLALAGGRASVVELTLPELILTSELSVRGVSPPSAGGSEPTLMEVKFKGLDRGGAIRVPIEPQAICF
jgi:hypothetical protein